MPRRNQQDAKDCPTELYQQTAAGQAISAREHRGGRHISNLLFQRSELAINFSNRFSFVTFSHRRVSF